MKFPLVQTSLQNEILKGRATSFQKGSISTPQSVVLQNGTWEKKN